jgi:predicted DNA binding CopG/RHH family protein
VDWSRAKFAVFPELKPSTRAISLRMPEGMLARIKMEAHKRNIPYQSLLKMWLSEKLDEQSDAGNAR